MKYFLIASLLLTTAVHAQVNLNFDKRFVESEDRWVAFQKGKDSTYMYGFIYIDAQAGLTLNYEGNFTISDDGTYFPIKVDSANFKIRLKPNNVLVAFIPESKYAELKIPAIPEWLQNYKTDTASAKRLYRWGYMYNGWGECAKGLTYLERAHKVDPKFKGLLVELAFSYNCLGQYDKAILVLDEALKAEPTDAYVHKELIYAQMKSGQLDKASESCKKAIEVCTDKTYHAENCYNLLYNFYKVKDKENFKLWVAETRKWTASREDMTRSIKQMEEALSK